MYIDETNNDYSEEIKELFRLTYDEEIKEIIHFPSCQVYDITTNNNSYVATVDDKYIHFVCLGEINEKS